MRVLETGPGHVTGHDIDIDDGELPTVDDLSSSMLEQWLAVMVEHASVGSNAGSSMRRTQPAAGGRPGRCPTALSGEEIDELSRAVRAGRFACIEDAVRARHGEAADQAAERGRGEGRQGCRIDHHVPPHEHTVMIKIKIKSKTRSAHRDRLALAPPVQSPPPF